MPYRTSTIINEYTNRKTNENRIFLINCNTPEEKTHYIQVENLSYLFAHQQKMFNTNKSMLKHTLAFFSYNIYLWLINF